MAAKVVYCAECGRKIPIFRKAIKGYGRIIELIPTHECSEEPEELDLTPIKVPPAEDIVNGKFKDTIDDLKTPNSTRPTRGFQDVRPKDSIKNLAPQGVLEQVKNFAAPTGGERAIDNAFDNESEGE